MKPFTVATSYRPGPFFEKTLLSLTKSALVERVVVVCQEPVRFKIDKCHVLVAGPLPSGETLSLILPGIQTKYLLLLPGSQQISVEPKALERILGVAESTKAGLVYPDFYDEGKHGKTLHPLNDYQLGSVRDDFDFGAMMLFSVPIVRKALKKYGAIPAVQSAGLYDLRLKVSIDHAVHHLQEPLYSVIKEDEPSRSVGAIHELPLREKVFAYVDPRNESVQGEMEDVFTDYLKRIGAYLSPHHLREFEQIPAPFPVEASVVIPVRNRRETIADAVKSALSQETDFPYNVLVVDNHSTDGTTAILAELAGRYSTLRHFIPLRTDLGIGGCWNEALRHEACGRYAVQLDSDDLYSSARSLQKMVDHLRNGNYAMVIGSYTLVDSRLEKIPPGLINHREWTDENGHNNALRINGLGAPRAFYTGLMREIRFLNVSYGEDYAAALRICREYRIRRIYESLYLCRRWAGNTDAALSIEEVNRNDAFKDQIRTTEILARQKIVQSIGTGEPALRMGDRPIAHRSENYISHMPAPCPSTHLEMIYKKTYARFDSGEGERGLPGLCLELLSEQKRSWSGLRKGCESLSEVRERDVSCRGFSVRLQHNPGRIKSSLAAVGEKNARERRCFLCPEQLPEAQKGLLYRGAYLILCNPMPIFSSHFTVSHVEHRPQAITEHIGSLLQLLADFGSGWVVLYNGPRCGASAPDHLHFQASPSGQMPVEQEIREERRLTRMTQVDGCLLHRVSGLGREVVTLEGDDPMAVEGAFKGFLNALKKVFRIEEEPMMNIAGFHEEGRWRLVIFPRRKHRPDAFFRKGDARVVVSPGLIDMGGVLVTPVEKDFERLDAAAVEGIYGEVSLETESVEKAIDAFG